MDISGSLAPQPVALQRAGDADRSTVCDELSLHYAAGRLSADELDARLGAAVAAPTLLELRRLVSDLPAVPVVAGPGPARWTPFDVLALLTALGCLGFAFLAVLTLVLGGGGTVVLVGLVAGTVAAAGGGATVHLAHRAWYRSATTRTGGPQRPRIA